VGPGAYTRQAAHSLEAWRHAHATRDWAAGLNSGGRGSGSLEDVSSSVNNGGESVTSPGFRTPSLLSASASEVGVGHRSSDTAARLGLRSRGSVENAARTTHDKVTAVNSNSTTSSTHALLNNTSQISTSDLNHYQQRPLQDLPAAATSPTHDIYDLLLHSTPISKELHYAVNTVTNTAHGIHHSSVSPTQSPQAVHVHAPLRSTSSNNSNGSSGHSHVFVHHGPFSVDSPQRGSPQQTSTMEMLSGIFSLVSMQLAADAGRQPSPITDPRPATTFYAATTLIPTAAYATAPHTTISLPTATPLSPLASPLTSVPPSPSPNQNNRDPHSPTILQSTAIQPLNQERVDKMTNNSKTLSASSVYAVSNKGLSDETNSDLHQDQQHDVDSLQNTPLTPTTTGAEQNSVSSTGAEQNSVSSTGADYGNVSKPTSNTKDGATAATTTRDSSSADSSGQPTNTGHTQSAGHSPVSRKAEPTVMPLRRSLGHVDVIL
jgi:hypothetical protein